MNESGQQQKTFNLKVLLILSVGHMVTDIYQGALPAILPFLKDKLSLTYAMAGLIMMASNFTSSVVQPLFGHLSDRREKGFLLPLGCMCAGIGISLLSMPSHYPLVLMLVVISGLGVASYHPEGYKTASFHTGDKMATGMSIFSVGGNLGFALGPIIALSIITYLGFDSLPLMIVFCLMFVGLLAVTWKSLAQTKSVSSGQAHEAGTIPRRAYIAVALVIATVIMRSWTQMGLMTYIPFYYIDYLKGDAMYAGRLVSALLLGGVVGTLLGSPLADRWGHKRYLIASLALTSMVLPLIFVTTGILIPITLGLCGMIMISSFTVTIVMAQQLLPRHLGVASGLLVGFAIGTGGIGVTLLGVIADYYGVPTALKAILVLPPMGLLLSLFIEYPLKRLGK
jgi:FSR family fosmidomycin resistance protein-like MFS transporter